MWRQLICLLKTHAYVSSLCFAFCWYNILVFRGLKMSSDSEASGLSDMNESNELSEDSEDDWGVVDSEILPYQDEPLAAEDEALDVDDSEEERDVDGLTPSTLAERYERTVCLESW